MACACGNSACDCLDITIPTGSTGATGTAGTDGEPGGWSLEWKFDTLASASGIANTYLRLNNATFSSVAEIYVSETNADSVDTTSFLNALDNSGDGGVVKVFKKGSDNNFLMGELVSSVDSGTYWTISFTHTVSNGSFNHNDVLVLTYSPRGEVGGNTMIDLKQGNFSLTASANSTLETPAHSTLGSFEIDISGPNIMENDDDTIRFRAAWVFGGPINQASHGILMEASIVSSFVLTTTIAAKIATLYTFGHMGLRTFYVLDIELYRVSASVCGIISKCDSHATTYTTGTGGDVSLTDRAIANHWQTDAFASVIWGNQQKIRVQFMGNQSLVGKLIYAENIRKEV